MDDVNIRMDKVKVSALVNTLFFLLTKLLLQLKYEKSNHDSL